MQNVFSESKARQYFSFSVRFWKSVSDNDDGNRNADKKKYGNEVDANDSMPQIDGKRTRK